MLKDRLQLLRPAYLPPDPASRPTWWPTNRSIIGVAGIDASSQQAHLILIHAPLGLVAHGAMGLPSAG